MEKSSKQKIKYIIWCLITVIILVSIFVGSSYYKDSITKQQVQELIIIYSSIAIPLQENILYYQGKLVRIDRITLVAMIGLFFLSIILTIWSREWEKRKETEKINFLYEQLLEFQKGS